MAGMTKSVSGSTTTYTITDVEGASIAVAVTQSFGAGTTLTSTTTGNLHQDGQLMLANLMQMVSTNLLP